MEEISANAFNWVLSISNDGTISDRKLIDDCVLAEGSRDRCISNSQFKKLTLSGGAQHTLKFENCVCDELRIDTSANSQEIIEFIRCRFKELAVAANCASAGLRFDRCSFTESVHFNDIKVQKPIKFNACRFHKYVDCSRAHFSSVSFYDSVFEQKAYFNDTCFGHGSCGLAADFSEATFEDGADFERSTFRGETSFRKAVFYEATTFTDIRFYGGNCGGTQDTNKDILVFASAQIFGFVGFRKGDKEQTQASTGTPSSNPCCKCVREGQKNLRIFEYAPKKAIGVDFRNIYIPSSRGLRFHSVNLEKCKVVGTNLDACYFNDVRWPSTKINLVHEIYRIYDHCEFLSRSKNYNEDERPDQCARLSKSYRDLKVAYEQDKDYIYASDFHYAEKDLRRINPQVPRPTKVQLILFWLINGYGERALRPVGWFLLFFVMGTLVYKHGDDVIHPQLMAFSVSDVHATVKMPGNVSEAIPNADFGMFPIVPWGNASVVILESGGGKVKIEAGVSGGSSGSAEVRWREAAGFSAATMAFLRPDFLVLRPGLSWTRVMNWVQTIVGPALFGMFALAIRNKLKR